ncbi:MAG: ABC transporter substrate-binding protein, partial [Alphaproteobacteria bacterium]|nr:ABC transporter substrate-binding protein [Alphaproteobacteria bacterium]
PTRRTFLQGTAAIAAVTASAPYVITPSKAQTKELIINTWGGSWTAAEHESLFKPFTALTGIQIKTSTPVTFAKLKAQVQSSNYEWDVSSMNPPQLKQADLEGLVEPLNWNIIDKSKLKVPVYANGLGFIALSTLLIYRTDKFPNGGPQNWADFWNVEKFPGKRSLYDRSFTALAYALLADGVPLDKLYPMDIDRAFKKMGEIKKHIRVWWTQGNQSQQLIQDGEVDMMAIWSARGVESIEKAKMPGTIVWNGAETYGSGWYVAKGTPRKDAAMQFLNFVVQAKPSAEFCKILPYGPLNPDAFQYITEEEGKRMPTYPAHQKVAFTPDSEWLAPRLNDLNERWKQFVAT